jgi:hypothetical protein
MPPLEEPLPEGSKRIRIPKIKEALHMPVKKKVKGRKCAKNHKPLTHTAYATSSYPYSSFQFEMPYQEEAPVHTPTVNFPPPTSKTLLHPVSNRTLAVWWEDDMAWYPAIVASRLGDMSVVHYDDGAVEELDMRSECWRYVISEAVRQRIERDVGPADVEEDVKDPLAALASAALTPAPAPVAVAGQWKSGPPIPRSGYYYPKY